MCSEAFPFESLVSSSWCWKWYTPKWHLHRENDEKQLDFWVFYFFRQTNIFFWQKLSISFLRYHQPRYCRIGCHTVAFWPTRSQWQQLQTTNRWPCRLFWLSTGFKWIQPHTPQESLEFCQESGDYYWRDCRRRCDCGHWHEDVRTIILGTGGHGSTEFLEYERSRNSTGWQSLEWIIPLSQRSCDLNRFWCLVFWSLYPWHAPLLCAARPQKSVQWSVPETEFGTQPAHIKGVSASCSCHGRPTSQILNSQPQMVDDHPTICQRHLKCSLTNSKQCPSRKLVVFVTPAFSTKNWRDDETGHGNRLCRVLLQGCYQLSAASKKSSGA